METSSQVVDPDVSRAKFEREVAQFRGLAGAYRERGWFLAEADFPIAIVVMAARNLRPSAVVTGVRFDYTDYDLRPPSVRLVDPYTAEPFASKDAPTNLQRAVRTTQLAFPGLPEGIAVPQLIENQPLLQAYGPEEIPFICLPGIREYHDHPGHSGDAWELHRTAGAGRLVRLLEVIDRYGTSPISQYNLEVRIQGYGQAEVPQ
ncbi:MAG TPA: putative metal-binding protein [Candidatus Dormibacteraeota bacterium]|nr:putative metal-binding protein [Candidatus Dormibacteraeota bacterium]